VIGYFDVAEDVRIRARKGLGIDRVYEVGEVLDFPRFFLGGFANPQPCDPRIRMVRFNFVSGESGVKQHAMQTLNAQDAASRQARQCRECSGRT
jgi:hypothetical protein